MNRINTVRLSLVFLMITPSAFAHTGLETTLSFMAGFSHPWLGVDHVLVMVAVGLWACRFGSQNVWQLPASFLALMAVGADLQFNGIQLPATEHAVALSVLVFGLILWRNWQTSNTIAIGLVALFAINHGYVHALEIPQEGQPIGYALGFLVATALLHALGIAAGLTTKPVLKNLQISIGVVSTLVGALLLVG